MSGGIMTSTLVADINADGFPDIVFLSACATNSDCSTGALGYLLGNGDGTFQSSSASQRLAALGAGLAGIGSRRRGPASRRELRPAPDAQLSDLFLSLLRRLGAHLPDRVAALDVVEPLQHHERVVLVS